MVAKKFFEFLGFNYIKKPEKINLDTIKELYKDKEYSEEVWIRDRKVIQTELDSIDEVFNNIDLRSNLLLITIAIFIIGGFLLHLPLYFLPTLLLGFYFTLLALTVGVLTYARVAIVGLGSVYDEKHVVIESFSVLQQNQITAEVKAKRLQYGQAYFYLGFLVFLFAAIA